MTTPTEAPREALPEPLEVVAWKSPMWRFYPTRFNAVQNGEQLLDPLVRLADAQSALESERQAHAADTARMDWMEKNPGRIKHSTGYRGAPDSWVWTDINGYGHDAANLRAAIDQAIARGAK